jgi:hypothetical protein
MIYFNIGGDSWNQTRQSPPIFFFFLKKGTYSPSRTFGLP